MSHNNFLISLTVVLSVFFSANVFANASCASLFDVKLWDKALPQCEEEKDYFRLGYIYHRKKDCALAEKNYRLNDTGTAFMNMGINRIEGSGGCSKNETIAIEFLETAVKKGKGIANNFLGDHYKKNNEKLAKKYYREALNSRASTSDFDRNNLSGALWEYAKLSTLQEKVDLFLGPAPPYNYVKQQLLGNLLLGWGNFWGTPRISASQLLDHLSERGKMKIFEDRLSKKFKAYFIGLQFEEGIGRTENFPEAYRMYLVSGAEGLSEAAFSRKRIRSHLTPKQLEKAQCLAEYGLKPSFLNKAYCRF